MFGEPPIGERAIAALEDLQTWFDCGSEFSASFEYVIYAATRQFATGPADSPPSQPFRGTLRQPLAFRRSILGEKIGEFTTGDGQLVIDNTDAYYDFLVQSYGVDGRRIVVRVGRPADAYEDRPIVFKGTANDWNIDETAVTIRLRDDGYKLDVPAQSNLYGGSGGADGGADLAQKRKPRAFGHVRNVAPPFVVPASLIYQVNDGAVNAVSAVYDRGAALTPGSDHADYAALAAATVAAGSYDTCLAEGFLRLGSSPAGTVTADVQGDKTGGTYVTTTGTIVRRLIGLATDIVDPDDLDVDSFTALETAQPAPVAYWLGPDDSATVADVVARLMGGIGGWGGFRRDGTFEVRLFTAPSGNAAAAFERIDMFDLAREPLPSGTVPPWRQRVMYARAWTVQDDLAGSVSAAHRAFVADPYRLAEASAATILTDHPLARDPEPIDAYFTDEADAQDEADRLLALYRTVRALYRMRLTRRALTLDLGDVIEVTYPRWDLSTGRPMRVVEISEDLSPPAQGSIDTVEVVAYG